MNIEHRLWRQAVAVKCVQRKRSLMGSLPGTFLTIVLRIWALACSLVAFKKRGQNWDRRGFPKGPDRHGHHSSDGCNHWCCCLLIPHLSRDIRGLLSRPQRKVQGHHLGPCSGWARVLAIFGSPVNDSKEEGRHDLEGIEDSQIRDESADKE